MVSRPLSHIDLSPIGTSPNSGSTVKYQVFEADAAQRSSRPRLELDPPPSPWATVSYYDHAKSSGQAYARPAGARFANSVIRALNGETGIVEPTFVKSPLYASEGVEYFASNVELGPEGVKKIHPIGEISAKEQELVKACLAE